MNFPLKARTWFCLHARVPVAGGLVNLHMQWRSFRKTYARGWTFALRPMATEFWFGSYIHSHFVDRANEAKKNPEIQEKGKWKSFFFSDTGTHTLFFLGRNIYVCMYILWYNHENRQFHAHILFRFKYYMTYSIRAGSLQFMLLRESRHFHA